jgi:outer membrane protein assembly complex protein YaeT
MKATDRFSSVAFRGAGLLLALLLGGTACLALAQAPATPGKYLVNDVIPQGNAQVPTPKIMGLIRTRPGQEYLQETVNEDVRRLYETHLFRNVDVALQYTPDGKVNVYFRFVELPSTIQEIVYHGAGHLKAEELDTITGLHKGTPLNPVANQMACQAIVRRYHEDGRAFASCQLVEGGQLGDTRVVFNITEGPVIKVAGIDFVGNSTFVSSARLATQVNSSHEWFGFIGGKYNETMARLDVAKLEEYYKSFGYQDVHIALELVPEDERHVRLVFHIQEGQRYKVKDTVVTNVKTFAPEQVSVLPKLHKGDFYNEQQADADVAAIKDYYGWAGYPTAVKKELFYPEPGLVLVRYDVQERPPSRVGQIFIVGNEVTRQNVILRQIPLYPGQVLTYPDLKTAEKNLDRLGIFTDPATGQHPSVSVIDPEVDSPFKDILVQVQEQRTGSLLFGVGVNSDAGLTGSVVLNERNFDILRPPTSIDDFLSGRAFRGAGQEFRLEAMPGTQVQRYAATFREPFLFDSPYSLTVGGYYFTRQYDEYDESRLGTRVTIGRRLSPSWSVSGTVRVEDVGVHNVSPFAPADFQNVVGDNFLVGLRGDVVYDSTDSFLRPTQGTKLDLSFEQITGDFTFPIVNIEGNQFWTVYQRPDGSGRHVLAFHSQFGWEGDQAPVFERFYAGGFRSLRGFAFRGVGPEIDGFRVGGDFMFLNSLEYQVPIKANDQIFMVAFIDSGTVEQRLEIKDYRVTAGVGIRFVVPMLGPVPIALDVGFPIVKGPNDHEQDFSFWLGFFH